MSRHRLGRAVGAVVFGGTLVMAALPGTAIAHERNVVEVTGELDGASVLGTATLDEEHTGRLKFTLFEKDQGDFVKVSTKRGDQTGALTYATSWDAPEDAKRCKVRAKFKSPDHDVSRMTTDAFKC